MKPKDGCIVCDIVNNKIASKRIYEDDLTVSVLDFNGANPGHCFVITKNHYTIIEQVPDAEIGRLFQVANKVSMAIFEGLGVQGTNIFLTNGIVAGQTVAHVTVNVIPRKEDDGINLQWQPKILSEEETSTIELKLKEQTKNIGIENTKEHKQQKEKEKEKKSIRRQEHQAPKPHLFPDEETGFNRQIRRLP